MPSQRDEDLTWKMLRVILLLLTIAYLAFQLKQAIS
jgi:hypothetical protein